MQDIYSKLQEIGFSKYESRVLAALMIGETMSATEIARKANIPRTSVYNILKNFTEKGICNEIETYKGSFYESIHYRIIQEKIENDFFREHKKKKEDLEKVIHSIVKYSKQTPKPGVTGKEFEIIKGFFITTGEIYKKYCKKAKKEILIVNRIYGEVSSEYDEITHKLIKGNGIVRAIYDINFEFVLKLKGKKVIGTPELLIKLCKQFESYGEVVRLSNNVPIKLLVVDRKYMIFEIGDNRMSAENITTFYIRNEKLIEFMVTAFEAYWYKAMTIKQFEKTVSMKRKKKVDK